MDGKFHITVTENDVHIRLDETVEEVDVTRFLKFDEHELGDLLRDHAAYQAYWEALAIRLNRRLEDFQDEYSKKWWSNARLHARFILEAYGDKTQTKDNITDMVIKVYSQDTSDMMRDKYASIAFKTFANKKGLYEVDEGVFYEEMYRWLLMEEPWYYETIVRTEKKLKEDYELVKVFARRLESRSFHVHEYKDLMKPKHGNVQPRSWGE